MAIKIDINEKVEVVIGTNSYHVSIPSLKKFSELDRDLKKLDPLEVADYYGNYFEKLGLPKSVSEQFTLKNWTVLIEELTGAKKQ